MNYHISAQITNMIAIAKTFETSCKMVATQDDGSISKEEAKNIKKINAATQKFIRELEGIQKP